MTAAAVTLRQDVFDASATGGIKSSFVTDLTTAGLSTKALTPFGTSSTTITAGTVTLQGASGSDANNCIVLDAGTNRITIKDTGVDRVIIGKIG